MAIDSSHCPTKDDRRITQSEEFPSLLARARNNDTAALGELLGWYVNYLTILATTQLNRGLQRRVSPSDLVQEALLAAHRDFRDFRGQSQAELMGWLRQILIHTLQRVFAHAKAGKRDIRREVSIDEDTRQLKKSSCNLAAILADRGPSPSSAACAREDAVKLADQLSKLRPHYRDVIVYRVLQGMPFTEIAHRMNRSPGAVRMLWLRALATLKVQGDYRKDH